MPYCGGCCDGAIEIRSSIPALVFMIGADVDMYGITRC
jgi:hypothetical protein